MSPTRARGVLLADSAAVLALLVVVLLVFREALGGDRVFFERDIGFYWYPQVDALVRALAEGAWPVWSPRFGFGAPMWADPGYQIAYPFTWLNLFFLPPTYYKLFVVAHCMIAGVGSYAFTRRVGLAPFPCFAGAVAWCLLGPFLSATNLNHHFASAAWMPWALFALEGALVTGSGAVFVGMAFAMMVLAGSGDVVLMTGLLSVAYAGAFLAADARAITSRLRRVGHVGIVAAVVAAALSAAQWLPTVAQLRLGSRLAFQPSDNFYWSVHPASLLDLLVPRLVADLSLRWEAKKWLFESREPFLSTLYLGLPALAAALFAQLHPARRLRLFAILSFVFFVLLALGPHTPLLPLLLHVKPMALFRYPSKYLFAAAVSWGLLVALGVDVWLRPWGPRERRYAAWVGLFLLTSGAGMLILANHPDLASSWIAGFVEPGHQEEALEHVSFRLSGVAWMSLAMAAAVAVRSFAPGRTEWTTVAVVALLVGNLVGIARTNFLLAPSALLRLRPGVAGVIGQRNGGRRVYVVSYPLEWTMAQMTHPPPGWQPEWRWFLGDQERLTPPSGARWGIDGSFDADFTGLTPKPVNLLVKRLGELVDPRARTRLLQVGAVDYLVALLPPVAEGVREIAAIRSIYTEPIGLYAVPDPLPKAYVVGRARPIEDAQALETLIDPSFDPRRELLLPRDAPGLSGGAAFEGTVREVERRSDRIVLDVETNAEGFVGVVESWAPEWIAAVDGRPTAVLRANLAFRAVRVPRGRHRVEMAYRPTAVFLGLGVTLGGVVALLVAWEVGRRRREPVPHSARQGSERSEITTRPD